MTSHPSVARRIAILPDAVADQIAAGEVVERPASAVKELLENAVDASAKQVRVVLEQGGKTLIEVSDDGIGMNRGDAVLSLDRHATSKISTAADLVGVRTFGFRGEALPAIASVSRFTMVTHTGESDEDGTEIQVTGGRIDRVGPAVRQRGTTVMVRGLFFNTPARRKFLRSTASETRAAIDAVSTIALANPTVGIDLTIDGQQRLSAPADQDAEARLAAVWGRGLAGTLVAVEYASGPVRVRGYAQRPGDAKPTGRRVQLFVNQRPFRDSFLVRAAEAGYRSAIHPGDRPSLYLAIEVAPEDVDVNVHPAKLEVRFRDRMSVERVVEEAVRDALGKLEASVPLGTWRPDPGGGRGEASWVAPRAGEAVPGADLFGETESADAARGSEVAPRSFEAPILQLFDTYIVFQGPQGLIVVDQHSAHERVLYEEILRQMSGPGAPAQRLLLPLTQELTDEELDVLESYRGLLLHAGYDVEAFGGRSVILQTVPTPHPRFDAGQCFRELVADLARGRFGGWSNRLERFAATYACRAAVKGGMPLAEPEMRVLLFRLFQTDLPPHDVHGRSTIVQLPREELERRFGRR